MSDIAECRHTGKTYPGGTMALGGVDLVVGEHEAVGLVGPNGAGKTTLVRILLGLLRPTAGSVRVFGQDAYRLPTELRRRVAFLLEETGIYDHLTAEENVQFWAKLYGVGGHRVSESLRSWGLLARRRTVARTLSAGMKRRLALARALLTDAPFCVMDEPTSNLDPEARSDIAALLRERGGGRTLLLSSQNLFDVERICRRIVLLRKGTVAAQGSMSDLAQQLGARREITIRASNEIPAGLELELAGGRGIKAPANNEWVLSDGLVRVRDAIRHLVEHGVDIERVVETDVSLEDVYLRIVKEDEAE